MKILENFDLSEYNTFGIKALAKFFIEINNEDEFVELLKTLEFKNNKKLFLGGGSNVLFTSDFDGIVVLNNLKGVQILKEDEKNVWIKSMGGETWNDLVSFSVDRGFWGMENLALIPGTVGATPVQNIGAYGVEIKDILENVEGFFTETGEKGILSNKDCEFGYRDSIFKNKLKNKFFITSVVFKLNKSFNDVVLNNKKPESKKIYPALKEYLERNNIIVKNPKDISEAVSDIRRSKLPDPKLVGNAGSFFKNVYINNEKFNEIKKEYDNVPSFEENGNIKIPTGWFIEKCGWKGKRLGNVGVYEKQALILVNYGDAKGEDIKNLSNEIIESVYSKFGIKIETEVNFI